MSGTDLPLRAALPPVTARPAQGESDAEIAVAQLTSRVAGELSQLVGLALELQNALSVAGIAQSMPVEASTGLQAIDRITQNLGDLSRLLAALGGQLAPSTTIAAPPLADELILRDLAHRLFGIDTAPEASAETSVTSRAEVAAPSGEICWF